MTNKLLTDKEAPRGKQWLATERTNRGSAGRKVRRCFAFRGPQPKGPVTSPRFARPPRKPLSEYSPVHDGESNGDYDREYARRIGRWHWKECGRRGLHERFPAHPTQANSPCYVGGYMRGVGNPRHSVTGWTACTMSATLRGNGECCQGQNTPPGRKPFGSLGWI